MPDPTDPTDDPSDVPPKTPTKMTVDTKDWIPGAGSTSPFEMPSTEERDQFWRDNYGGTIFMDPDTGEVYDPKVPPPRDPQDEIDD